MSISIVINCNFFRSTVRKTTDRDTNQSKTCSFSRTCMLRVKKNNRMVTNDTRYLLDTPIYRWSP